MKRKKFKNSFKDLINPNRPDYNDIEATFLAFTQVTIPFGLEHLLEPLLPEGIQKDGWGNYFITIGKSETLFSSHLDVACGNFHQVKQLISEQGESRFIHTDGKTILGGDNKAGVTILCHMIHNKIPGTYYFFAGEEVGAVGSSRLAEESIHNGVSNLSRFKRAIAFDRRGYDSIITKQMGQISCSGIFADALAREFENQKLFYKPDPTGIFTDTACFIGLIPECTNISAGVFNEHQKTEHINITFLKKLAAAACLVNWENLPYEQVITGNISDLSDNLKEVF